MYLYVFLKSFQKPFKTKDNCTECDRKYKYCFLLWDNKRHIFFLKVNKKENMIHKGTSNQ